jgi:pimeloyl-ACP methyl ester carboxylesterase
MLHEPMHTREAKTAEEFIGSSYEGAKTVELKSGTACFVRKGSGEPLILLHGIPLSLITWRFNIDPLSTGLDVIALDMKGFGKSGNGSGSYSPAGHAQFLLEFLDQLGLERAAVAGSSYACAVAMTLAVQYPERVKKLVLINSVGYPSKSHSVEQLVRIKGIRSVLRRSLSSRLIGRRALNSGLVRSYADSRIASPGLVDAYFDVLRLRSHEESFLATLEAFHESEVGNLVPRVMQESLVIWGAQDHVLPVGNAALFGKNLPHGRVEVIRGAGHLPHEEASDLVNAAILNFVMAADGAAKMARFNAVDMGFPVNRNCSENEDVQFISKSRI